jgi:hypothetical protein
MATPHPLRTERRESQAGAAFCRPIKIAHDAHPHLSLIAIHAPRNGRFISHGFEIGCATHTDNANRPTRSKWRKNPNDGGFFPNIFLADLRSDWHPESYVLLKLPLVPRAQWLAWPIRFVPVRAHLMEAARTILEAIIK